MPAYDLVNQGQSVITSKDSIVIVNCFATKRGGATLDTTGYLLPVINAGHVIIKQTSNGYYKPMPASVATVGNIATTGTIVPGSGYANGVYENVPLTGGSGTGAIATVTVSGGVVTVVTRTSNGQNYKVADSLSALPATIGGTGTGFSIPVATIASTAATYGTLPAGHTYAGVLNASVLTAKPAAAIMTWGIVNPIAAPFPMTSILSAFQAAALAEGYNITFKGDE